MHAGFEVVARADGSAAFYLSRPAGRAGGRAALVTYAADARAALAVVLVGRLYYREDLRGRLGAGDPGPAASDAELALAAYREHDSRGLQSLEGDYALVLADSRAGCLLAARDPLGRCPLYWTADGETVRVSNRLLTLARRLDRPEVNADYLAAFLSSPHPTTELPGEITPLRAVRRVAPGAVLRLRADRRAEQVESWEWSAQVSAREQTTPAGAAEQLLHLFREAVRQRLASGPTACQFSGGMDSSSVVCVARRLIAEGLAPGPLTALALVYSLPGIAGERRYMELVVEQGGPLVPCYLDGDCVPHFDWFDTPVPPHDEPYPGLFEYASQRRMVEAAQEAGAVTVLTGVGAELTLQGNQLHLADLLRQGRLLSAWEEAGRWAHAHNANRWAVLWHSGLGPLCPAPLAAGLGPWLCGGRGRWPRLGRFTIPPWIPPAFARSHCLQQRAWEHYRRAYRHPAEWSFTLLGLEAAVGDWNLAHLGLPAGVWTSSPFLDPRLVTFCLGLPRPVRDRPGEVKAVLREAMRGLLPEPIRSRRYKQGFNAVYGSGLAHSLADLEQMVRRSALEEAGLLDKNRLLEALRQHAAGIGDAEAGMRLCAMLALIAWFEPWAKAIKDAPEGRAESMPQLPVSAKLC